MLKYIFEKIDKYIFITSKKMRQVQYTIPTGNLINFNDKYRIHDGEVKEKVKVLMKAFVKK